MIDYQQRSLPTKYLLLGCVLFLTLLYGPGIQGQTQATDQGWSTPITLSQLLEPNEEVWNPVIIADQSGGLHVLWTFKPEGSGYRTGEVIFYSHWDGTSWSDPVDILLTPGQGGTGLLAVTLDSQGMIHLMWAGLNTKIYYSRAAIQTAGSAQGWASPTMIASLARQGSESSIAADQSGGLHIAYSDATGESEETENWAIYYLHSTDGGDHWSAPANVSGSTENITGQPVLACDRQGTVHVAWVQYANTSPSYSPIGIYYARSSDDGKTWSPPIRIAGGPDYTQPSMITIGADNIHIVWNGTRGTPGRYHSWSSNGGQTWTESQKIIPQWGFTGSPALAVDSSETLHMLTTASAVGLNNAAPFYSYWDGANWSEPLLVFTMTESVFPKMTVSEGNKVNVVWLWIHGDSDNLLNEIVYTSRRSAAPRVQPKPLPTLPPEYTSAPSQTAAALSTRTPLPAGVTPQTQPLPPSDSDTTGSLWLFVLAGVLPSAALLIAIVTIHTTKARNR